MVYTFNLFDTVFGFNFQVICGIVVKYGFQYPVFKKNGYVLKIRLVYGMNGISFCKSELYYSCIYFYFKD